MTQKPDERGGVIPGLYCLCGQPDPRDGRLKVAWIEDKTEVQVDLDLTPFLQVTRLVAPETAESIVKAQRHEVSLGLGAEVYELAECPYDVYIADFRLNEAETGVFGGKLSLAAHADAAGASLAVLMAANFPGHPATIVPYTAYEEQLRAQWDLLKRLCPDSINAIWGEELGKDSKEFSNLIFAAIKHHREFLPRAALGGFVHVRAVERDRLKEALLKAVEGKAPVPWDDRIELETLWGRRSVLLFSLWPELRVRKGAAVSGNQLKSIVEWLGKFPVPRNVDRAAAELAYTFFRQRLSLRSYDRYLLGGWLRNGIGPKDEKEVAVVCGVIGLDQDAVQAFAEAVKTANGIERELEKVRARQGKLEKKVKGKAKPSGELVSADAQTLEKKLSDTRAQASALLAQLEDQRKAVEECGDRITFPKAWTCPHLLSREMKSVADQETLRMAVLFLLVYEAWYRWRCSEELVENLSNHNRSGSADWLAPCPYETPDHQIAEFVEQLRRRAEAAYAQTAGTSHCGTPIELRDVQLRLQSLEDLLGEEGAAEFVEDLDPEANELLRAMGPVTTSVVARLVDPLPEQIQTADADFKEGRIDKALVRAGLDIVEFLAGRGRGGVSDAEAEAMARFALDIGFVPLRAWPRWLRWLAGRRPE